MESSCRLCGKHLEAIRVNIFEPDSDYVKKIHKVLPITVNEYDPFPKNMCHRCSYKVNDFYEFRTTTIKAQELFKSQIPWLRDKQECAAIDTDRPPMVRLPVSVFNSITPAERQTTDATDAERQTTDAMDAEPICIEDDDDAENESPQQQTHGDSDMYTVLENQAENVLRLQKQTRKKPRRSIWDSKCRRRRKRNQIGCKITEVFTTSEADFGNGFEQQERDPLASGESEEGQEEVAAPPEPGLPMSILVTEIPGVGAIYTCERCGLTLLSRDAALRHACTQSDDDESFCRLMAAGGREEGGGRSGGPYSCDSCHLTFSRRSQLESHSRSHFAFDSSSDERSPKPKQRRPVAKKRRRPASGVGGSTEGKREEEQRKEGKQAAAIEDPLFKSNLARHLILSSSDSD